MKSIRTAAIALTAGAGLLTGGLLGTGALASPANGTVGPLTLTQATPAATPSMCMSSTDHDDNDDDGRDGNRDHSGDVQPGQLDNGKELLPQATITLEQAVTAAQAAAQGTLGDVDLEMRNGVLVFDVSIGNQDVDVSAADGSIVTVRADDNDHGTSCAGGGTPVAGGALDHGNNLLPQATITLDQAIAAAQAVATGPVGEVDLEMEDGVLVFKVDVGNTQIDIDAATGQVVQTDNEDD